MKSSKHQFQITTFHKPTYCDYCKKFLWGLIFQGYTCDNCHFICHPHCRLEILEKTEGEGICPNTSPEPKNNPLSPAILHSVLEPKPSVSSAYSTQAVTSHSLLLTADDSKTESVAEQLKKFEPEAKPPSTSPFLTQLFTTAQQHEEYLKKSRTQPALNLFTTTPQNLTKFLNRVTFLRRAQSTILTILTWESPKLTWLVLAGYLGFIFYFKAVIILLQLVLLLRVIQSYATPTEFTDSINGPSEPPMLSVQEYSLNFQFIQNFMGTYIEIYDTVRNWEYHLEKNDQLKKSLIYSLPIAIISTALLFELISIKYFSLITGCGILLSNHPLIMALMLHSAHFLKTDLIENTKIKFRANSTNRETQRYFYYFENERWWMGLGWQPRTLSLERPNWSLPNLDPLDDPLAPPGGYQWKEEQQATLDHQWCHPIKVNRDGWIYSDSQWNHPSTTPYLSSFTRRRLWRRPIVASASTSSKP